MKISRGQRADTVLVLAIFLIFAVSVLMVLTLSASIYGNMTDISKDGFEERTALSYVWTMVKNHDLNGDISVGEFNGISALIINEEYDWVSYSTRIYVYDGRLHVLFSETELDFEPQDGVPVYEAPDLFFEQIEHGLIKVSSGNQNLLIYPRSTAMPEGGFWFE